jgi:hypothetical protein
MFAAETYSNAVAPNFTSFKFVIAIIKILFQFLSAEN